MKRVYVGGSLFNEAQINQRLSEAEYLYECGVDYYCPIQNEEINDKSNLPTASDIYFGDLDQLLNCNILLADISNEDVGLATEIGILVGYNVQAKLEGKKPPYLIVAHNSDIRIADAHNYKGVAIPVGWNQFLIGAVLENGVILGSSDDAIDYIVNLKED